MKVIYIGTMGVPAKYGGLETCVEMLSTSLVSEMDEVIVFSVFEKTNSLKKLKYFRGVKVKYIPQTGNPAIDRILREIFPIFFYIFKRERYIVHIFGPSIFSFIWRLLKHKIVHSLDGLEWKRNSYSMLIRSVVFLGYYLGVKFSNIITVDARFVSEWTESLGKKAIFIPYGPKPLLKGNLMQLPFGLEKDEYYVFVGRLVPEKGVHILIKAFKQIDTSKKLLLLGEDPHGGRYLAYLKKIAINDPRIIFGGKVFGYTFQSLLTGSFAHIRSSINNSEGINPVAIESLAYGLLIIASDVDQNREAFGDCAIYFKPSSIRNLISTLKSVEKISPQKILHMKRISKQRAQKSFSWSNIIKKNLQIYRSLSNQRTTKLEVKK